MFFASSLLPSAFFHPRNAIGALNLRQNAHWLNRAGDFHTRRRNRLGSRASASERGLEQTSLGHVVTELAGHGKRLMLIDAFHAWPSSEGGKSSGNDSIGSGAAV